ncbi:MAG: hypothetical protein EA350_09290 [Gemmatimonadales bacterium]|nr:MAG: hypothetical protein EA350_09290 [Gemmatimonadales bacterium]
MTARSPWQEPPMSWWGEVAEGRVIRQPGALESWAWEEFQAPPEPVSAPEPVCPEVQRESDLRQAFEEGRATGEAATRDALAEEYAGTMETMRRALGELESLAQARESAAEERVLALSLAVARVLLDRELRSDPGEVTQMVRRALAHFPAESPLRVRLHPEDLTALAMPAAGESEPPTMGRRGGLQWEADTELERGDVVVESPERILDGRVIPCLERIWEEIAHV